MKKLEQGIGLVKRAYQIWSEQYHYHIPKDILAMYVRKFVSESRNIQKYSAACFNPYDAGEYAQWRALQDHGRVKPMDLAFVRQGEVLSLAEVKSEYVCVMNRGTVLYPGFFRACEELKCCDVLYFDSDLRKEDGTRYCPWLKPDFSYDTLRSYNYIGDCYIVKTELLRQFVGQKWRPYEWLLAWSDQKAVFRHVNCLAYGSRQEYSGAEELKEYIGKRGSVHVHADGIVCDVQYELKENPLVSILIPSKDGVQMTKRCVDSILRKTTYPNIEIILMDNGSKEPETLQYFHAIAMDERFRVLPLPGAFNFSYLNNCAVKQARGKYVVLMNNDIIVQTPDWLEKMLSYGQLSGVGSVGCKLYYPDGTIQHAGILAGRGGVAAHRCYRQKAVASSYLHRQEAIADVAGCTAACLLVKKSLYEELGGLKEDLAVNFNDVDFAFRLLDAGYRNVYLPMVEMIHDESKTRGMDTAPEKVARYMGEIEYMKSHWAKYIAHDPFYHDGLDKSHEEMLRPNCIETC